MTVTIADVGLALRRGRVLADDGQDYATVQAAQDAASSFIWLPPETFTEQVTVDTPEIVILGSGRDTLIDGTDGEALTISSDNVVVMNLSARGTPGGGTFNIAINGATTAANGVIVSRCWVRDSDHRGISLGPDGIVENCVIENADDDGIQTGGTKTIIRDNIVNNVGGPGIDIDFDDAVVSGNIINSSSGIGINVRANDGVVVGNRIISSGGDGIEIEGGNADSIIANNNITGSGNADIDDSGTNTLIDANVPSVVLTVDDFESGNITSVTAPWNNWAGSTGSFSAQTGTVLAGSQSGQLAAANANVAVRTDRNDDTNAVTKVECLVQISNQSTNANDVVRVELRDGTGTLFAVVEFEGDGDIVDGGGTDQGDWSAGTEYRVEFTSLDFDGETYSFEVIQTSNSSTVASVTGRSFENSVAGLGRFRYRADSTASTQTTNAFLDEIKTTR